ncbi:MAG: DUF423 domain-containing protein [Longimicrobiales bacterium]
MDRVFFVLGCVFAFLGVAAGAFGAHALEQRVPADRLATFEIGARYQMYHALALLALAWAASRWPGGAWRLCGLLFVGGVLVFSGTLYGIGLGGPRWLGAITPIGGAWLLAGWVVAGLSVWRRH